MAVIREGNIVDVLYKAQKSGNVVDSLFNDLVAPEGEDALAATSDAMMVFDAQMGTSSDEDPFSFYILKKIEE